MKKLKDGQDAINHPFLRRYGVDPQTTIFANDDLPDGSEEDQRDGASPRIVEEDDGDGDTIVVAHSRAKSYKR